MDLQQLFTLLASERQKQTEDLKVVLQTNQDLWRASQVETGRRHEELVHAMGEQCRTFAQLLQGTTAGGQRAVLTAGTGDPVGVNSFVNMQLCKMGPTDAPDDFLLAFERMAVAAGWPEQQWATRLIPCLAGTALAAYQTLSPELASNYRAIKNHILDYLGYTREHYRQEFRSTQLKDKERPKALLHRLRKLAERWLQPCLTDPQAMLAEILQEQFLEALPKNLRAWIQRQGSRPLGQVIELAEAYIDSSTSLGSEGGTHGNTFVRKGTYTTTGAHSKAQEEYQKPGRKAQDTGTPNKMNITCFRCGKTGHIQKQCRVKLTLTTSRGGAEVQSRPYEVQVQINGQKVKALLDTGAEQSIMSRSCWEKVRKRGPFRKISERVAVICVHGEKHTYPSYLIPVVYKEEVKTLGVAVIPGAPVALILGRDWTGLGEGIQERSSFASPRESGEDRCTLMTQDSSNERPKKDRSYRYYPQQGGRARFRWYPTIRWAPLSEHAQAPTQAYDKAAGCDIYAAQDVVVEARDRALVPTDIQVSPPPGSYLRVAARSGLSLRHSLDVGAGVIDPDFRGNVSVLLINHGGADYPVKRGDRIAQLICERIWHPKVEKWRYLRPTRRGMKGFGSTNTPLSGEVVVLNPAMTQEDQDSLTVIERAVEQQFIKLQRELTQGQEDQRQHWEQTVQHMEGNLGNKLQETLLQKDQLLRTTLEENLQQCQKDLQALKTNTQDIRDQMQHVEKHRDPTVIVQDIACAVSQVKDEIKKVQTQVEQIGSRDLKKMGELISSFGPRVDSLEESFLLLTDPEEIARAYEVQQREGCYTHDPSPSGWKKGNKNRKS
uniref:Uncharacterized protein LOC117365936 n=1 Tax=Geotrypetes seraphini TaxID=260995 RepID=A0A6P8S4W4_GEOSA|nr:uncharacterized protein LOC117365936 [Geotrypetes seraphini]